MQPFLTPPEIAKLLRVRRETVLAWIKSGKLPAMNVSEKIRPSYRIAPDDLDRFKTGRMVQAPPTPNRRRNQPDVTEYY
jgi:excisionase family DNA binding protein